MPRRVVVGVVRRVIWFYFVLTWALSLGLKLRQRLQWFAGFVSGEVLQMRSS